MERKKIAFIPGAFRPFGRHHLDLVGHYADDCDKVVVVVSDPTSEESARKTNLGGCISAKDAREIAELCLKDAGLGNVECRVSGDENPIKTVLRCIAALKDCDVVLGVSTKDGDQCRFSGVDLDYFADNGVRIAPPAETAVEPSGDDLMSASQIREHIDDREMLRMYLPVSVEDDTFERIYGILNGKSQDRLDTHGELRRGSQIFQSLVEEADDAEVVNAEVDEEEGGFPQIRLDDEAISDADCGIIAYNVHVGDGGGEVYTPKTDPDKAVDVVVDLKDGNSVEIFLDTDSRTWCSRVNGTGCLTPEQMGRFFSTDFSRKMTERLCGMWPEKDPFFAGLLEAVRCKRVDPDPAGIVSEDGEFRKGNIDKERSRGKNAAGKQIYTNSGRKIVSFSDFGVKHTEDEAYFCWPAKGKEFKWSQWADWTKIHPLCRCRFNHTVYLYGISLSLFPEDDENRGFRAYNLDLEPKLQYLTPIETEEILHLSLIEKFLRNCLHRLNKYVSMSDNEIFERVNRPDKCTLDDIRKTKHMVMNTMKAIRGKRADTYIYT